MNLNAYAGQLEAFFLPIAGGKRFAVFYPPMAELRGGILYIHPFGDEMNKSRRMAATQARALAARGMGVLQIDLLGCGDSSGDLGDASWELWQQDVLLGIEWLRERVGPKITLWGLRLGALLALDAARHCDFTLAAVALWQPIISGEQFITQFLRILVINQMMATGAATTATQQLRERLIGGEHIEVAGYSLGPQLARAIVGLKLVDLASAASPVHWFEIVAEAGRPLPFAAQRVADAWTHRGVPLTVQCVHGQPFWSTIEITECTALIAETSRVLARVR